jgi:hypothetical protein
MTPNRAQARGNAPLLLVYFISIGFFRGTLPGPTALDLGLQ